MKKNTIEAIGIIQIVDKLTIANRQTLNKLLMTRSIIILLRDDQCKNVHADKVRIRSCICVYILRAKK